MTIDVGNNLDRSVDYARKQDSADPLSQLRQNFIFPSIADLKRSDLVDPTTAANVPSKPDQPNGTAAHDTPERPCTYLCGNSLGLQPRVLRKYVDDQLRFWATKGVYGHFKSVQGTPLVPWTHVDGAVQAPMAKLVGAHPDEVAVMQTLTANLHLLLATFYRPTATRHKIIIEAKAFPSDHYAVESQLRHHGRDPTESMILLQPPSEAEPLLSTAHVLSVIDAHADSTALLMLPGIQFYTGQLFDIPRITAHAQAKGIVVGWDLAHAAGNVPLALHDWNVDFAAWCTYKYLNCGPGAIGALFVHTRHAPAKPVPRLEGWWGNDLATRFDMNNARFDPSPGARAWQLSNPSALDMAAVMASLSVFARADMPALRARSLALTGYLERLLDVWPYADLANGTTVNGTASSAAPPYRIITPRQPDERGAQLSILLQPGLLDHVMEALEEAGVVIDERKPDVVRVAPAPLYNSFEDCWRFVDVFQRACHDALTQSKKA